jgi:hypothetical protein
MKKMEKKVENHAVTNENKTKRYDEYNGEAGKNPTLIAKRPVKFYEE